MPFIRIIATMTTTTAVHDCCRQIEAYADAGEPMKAIDLLFASLHFQKDGYFDPKTFIAKTDGDPVIYDILDIYSRNIHDPRIQLRLTNTLLRMFALTYRRSHIGNSIIDALYTAGRSLSSE